MPHTLVIDIETAALADAENLFKPFKDRVRAGKTEGVFAANKKSEDIVEKKAALAPILGRVLCIGVLEMGTGEETFHFIYDKDEKKMLEQLKNLILPHSLLVTFNGRGFDFPFLMFRAAIYRMELTLPIYRYNGRDNHIDLMLHLHELSGLSRLDSYSFNFPTSLRSWIQYFEIPIHKKSIKEGEINLLELALTDQPEIIKEYVKGDVEATASLYKIFEGTIDAQKRSWGGDQ